MVLIRILLILLLVTPALPASATELSVFAASSLTEALRDLVRNYKASHADTRILLNFAGSQTLATQIEQGAPADLFISANQPVMEQLQRQELVETPLPLLRNQLALAVRRDLAPAVTTYQDLARPGLLLVIGNHQVPIGRYTRQLLAELASDPDGDPTLMRRIEENVVSEENQVKAILTKLQLGEADAGIIYHSDLTSDASRDLLTIPLPPQHLPQISYPLARVRGGALETEAFVDYLYSEQARLIFARYGLQRESDQ